MARLLIGFAVITSFMLHAAEISPEYRKEITAWQEHREKGLRSERGWLTLAGLFWLKR
jgi:uncharacterized protein (DUF1684 family)